MIRRFFLKMMKWTLKFALSLRYKIEVKGKEVLKDPRLKGHGVLVLPNHSSEIEPFILLMLLGDELDLQPLVTERFYYYPFAKPFMKLVRAKPVADFDRAISEFKLKKAEKLFGDVVEELNKGGRILLYPGGALKDTGKEKIGGRSLAHATMQEAENAEILLVRTTGMWGSLFSRAYTRTTPDFWATLFKGIGILLKNGIFFAPRRHVTIEFAIPDKDFPYKGKRMEFNHALEEFYNQYPTSDDSISDTEELKQVPYAFWTKKVPEITICARRPETVQELSVPNHIRQDIMYQLSELSDKSVNEIDDYNDLVQDVGLDSLNIASLYSYLDAHYDIDPSIDPVDLQTVQDLFRAAMHVHNGKRTPEESDKEKGKSASWPRLKKNRPEPKYTNCDTHTLIENFLLQCDRMGNHAACADMASGVMTYATLKRAVVIMARKIEQLDGEYIGIMLPSSSAAHIFIMATLLAGKVPVPLNWTVGSYFMNHAIDLMEIKHILSSGRFLQRLNNVELGKALDKLILAEDIKKGLTLKEKIGGALLAKRPARKILERFPAFKLRENDTAIVLFTSGTTALPKAVPLTHKNILSNQKCAIDSIDLALDDVMIMALPPFHVFGLTIGILPLLTGLRVVFSPDPLDGATIAREILKWRVSMIVLAPTFYSHLFRVATLSQLKSLRVFISGAERAPPSLMNFINKLGDVWFLEGYGLTETSPIISVNQIYTRPRGVGKIVPSVEAVIVDQESERKLGPHQIGEVCVRGDSVFKGYYKQDNSKNFIEIDGKSYFRTGDLGYLDEDNYLHLEGRLKLSFKRGGEMINVVAIEAVLFQKAKEKGWIPQDQTHSPFACVPKEVPTGATKVVLFSELPLALDQVNAALFEAGFARLYKVNEIKVIDQIPMLKSGKVCLRKLFDMLEEKESHTPKSVK